MESCHPFYNKTTFNITFNYCYIKTALGNWTGQTQIISEVLALRQ